MKNTNETVIESLIAIYGSANKTAKALNCNRQIVDNWRKAEKIPFRWGKPIEAITKGKIKAIQIWEEAGK